MGSRKNIVNLNVPKKILYNDLQGPRTFENVTPTMEPHLDPLLILYQWWIRDFPMTTPTSKANLFILPKTAWKWQNLDP